MIEKISNKVVITGIGIVDIMRLLKRILEERFFSFNVILPRLVGILFPKSLRTKHTQFCLVRFRFRVAKSSQSSALPLFINHLGIEVMVILVRSIPVEGTVDSPETSVDVSLHVAISWGDPVLDCGSVTPSCIGGWISVSSNLNPDSGSCSEIDAR